MASRRWRCKASPTRSICGDGTSSKRNIDSLAVVQPAIDHEQDHVHGRCQHDQQERDRHDQIDIVNISPSTVPISVSEKPTRMPVKISGTAAGNRISRTMTTGLSFMTRPVLIKIGLVVRTAFKVNNATGMIP